MGAYAIVTDTDSSLPAALAARFGIRQVPINIHFGQETHRAGVDLDDAELCARIDRAGRMPTTSAPAPGQFAEAYAAAHSAGAVGVICLTVSARGSATYAAAQAGCQLLPECDITVVDILPRQELTQGRWAWVVNGLLWALVFHAGMKWSLVGLIPSSLITVWIAQRFKNTTTSIVIHVGGNALLFWGFLLVGVLGIGG